MDWLYTGTSSLLEMRAGTFSTADDGKKDARFDDGFIVIEGAAPRRFLAAHAGGATSSLKSQSVSRPARRVQDWNPVADSARSVKCGIRQPLHIAA